MSRLRIRHETVYSFETLVNFGVWRLMMRPVDTHAIRVLDASFELSPPGSTRWALDAFGNCVCLFQPQGPANELRVVNHLLIERYPAPLDLAFDPTAVVDNEEERNLVLAPFSLPVTSGDRDFNYRAWLTFHAPEPGEAPLDFLKRFNSAIRAEFAYATRDEEGVQTPLETIERKAGACRDFAWLMIESMRRWGVASRFVTGYLYSPNAAIRGAGATHAWCEAFLPDLGWIEFDPTNGLAESPDLIRVAATRTPQEASPMSGGAIGTAESALEVHVSVSLASETQNA